MHRNRFRLTWTVAACLILLAVPDGADAGTYTISVQPDTATSDGYLREDNADEKNGGKTELDLNASGDAHNRNAVVRIPLTGLAGKSVVQAWLRLTQFGSNAAVPIDARVYPLTEPWFEPEVTWSFRAGTTPWASPGGTRSTAWSDRLLVSQVQTGSEVGWQVGPILQAWQLGVPNHGLVIVPDRGSPNRAAQFRSSESGTAATRPRIVIYYTDEAPAIRQGMAEIQPRAVQSGAANTAITLWLDIDALNATPSGLPTGFDALTLVHRGALAITGVDRMLVGGVPIVTGLVSWSDAGSAVTFRFPRVRTNGQVRLDLRATVLAGATPGGVDMPMLVDDTSTSGAWAQSLSTGDADHVAGNGDDWILAVTASPTVLVDLTPDVASIVNRTCTTLQLIGQDAAGNRYAVAPDSTKVIPPAAGTMAIDGTFCANIAGTARVVAWYGGLRDTSVVQVTAALTPAFAPAVLRTRAGATTGALVPADTMLLDVSISDGDGFKDVTEVEFDLFHSTHGMSSAAPAFHATGRWRRGDPTPWQLVDPAPSTWSLVPSLCQVDTITNATTAQLVRMAFTVGRIARASSSGEWNAAVRVLSATPPDTTSASQGGLNAAARISLGLADHAARFSSAFAGSSRLPIAQPSSGNLGLALWANDAYQLEGWARDLVGVTQPGDTLFVHRASQPLAWSFDPQGAGGGTLDTAAAFLMAGPAPTGDAPIVPSLYIWSDYPAGLPAQDYSGALDLRASLPAFAVAAPVETASLTAGIVTGGLAAQSADAEITPHQAIAGSTAVFDAYVLPHVSGSDTGVNSIAISLPSGYGAPSVISVRVSGAAVAFADSSRPGTASAALGTTAQNGQLIRVRFAAEVPTAADGVARDFVVTFDDTSTLISSQAAREGDANLVEDGDTWRVTVGPGPLASLIVSPEALECAADTVAVFTASGEDAYKNATPVSASWSVTGGIGSVTADGTFTAARRGTGFVIAHSGAITGSAAVTVHPRPGIAIRTVSGPASLVQGQNGAAFQVLVENLSDQDVRLDNLALDFSRAVRGDANGELVVTGAPSLPLVIAADGSASIPFSVSTSTAAAPGTVFVDASGAGRTLSGDVALGDDAADATRAVSILPASLDVSGSQLAAAVHPGDSVAVLTLRLHNRYTEARTLRLLTVQNRTTGGGSSVQLDHALGSLGLYLDDGDERLGPSDLPVASAVVASGAATFDSMSVALAPGQSTTLLVAAHVPLDVRDGDALDLKVASATTIGIEPASVLGNSWPIDPAGAFAIDGMVAAQIALEPVPPRGLNPGTTDLPALQVVIPANGYQPDVLQSLAVVNLGSARSGSDIARMRAWADDGNASFSALSDRLLGTLVFTGDRWQLTLIDEPVPVGGLRLFFTVDLDALAAEGGTLRFALPSGNNPGVGMASADDGPLDQPVANPFSQTITNDDRVTFEAGPLVPASARPGDRDVPLLQLRALNTYSTARTLNALTVTNATTGSGTPAQLDGEVRQLVLRKDGNGNGLLDGTDVDPAIATGFYVNGRALFDGLAVVLPPHGSGQLFVTAEIARAVAADGDVLSARVASSADVDFVEPSTIAGGWPLDSGAGVTLDGFSSRQLDLFPTPSATVSPGDGPLLALDVVVPANGYRGDVLQSVRVVNTGTASTADLATMQLWRDGGDGSFSAGGGDDVPLGTLTPLAGIWQSPVLSVPVSAPGTRLFASITFSASASESVTVRLRVPRNGIDFVSGNDGPNDLDVDPSGGFLVSASPLLASLVVPAASTVGQSVPVRMILRNVGSDVIENIVPGELRVSGGSALVVTAGPSPASLTLAPGGVDSVTWTCSAAAAGEVHLDADAAGTDQASGLPRRALRISSGAHRVYLESRGLDVIPVKTMPVSVQRGQTDVVPFSLTLTNPAGPGSSDVRMQSLRMRIEDDAGNPIVPAQLLQRVTVSEGTSVYLVKSALETSGSDVSLPLATPALITGTEPATLTLRLDILAATTVASFRVAITDSLGFVAQDVTSLAPATVHVQAGYPIRSDVARIVVEATGVTLLPLAGDTVRTSPGAYSVPLLGTRVENPGVSGLSSDVRLSALGLELRNAATGLRVAPNAILSGLRVRSGAKVHLARALVAADTATLVLALSPPLNLPANTPVDLVVEGDLGSASPLGRYRARLSDPAAIEARDATTRTLVPASFPQDSVAGSEVRVESPADTLRVAGTPLMPERVLVGQAGVPVISATLRHPGAIGTARIRLDGLSVECRNQVRAPLVPATFLSRMRVTWNGNEVAQTTALPASGGSVTIALPGLTLEPGDSAIVTLVIDVNATAPTGWIELMVTPAGIIARDANTGSPVTAAPAPGAELPILSGLGQIESPARLLSVGLDSHMPAVLAADGVLARAGTIVLANDDSTSAGAIMVDHMRVRAADRAFAPLALGAVAERIEARVDGVLWAQSAGLTADSTTATLVAGAALAVEASRPRSIELQFVPRGGAPGNGVRLGCDRADIGVVQPSSALLAVAVQPRSGAAFPLWTSAGGLTPADLSGSYSNFPNPFAAGRGATTVVYFLRTAAHVSLEILTARGDGVITVLRDEAKSPGLHQEDTWDGRNGRGETVYNGVYIARLTARYEDGTSESLMRKMAVVR